MPIDKTRLIRDLRALYPEELLEGYASGERDFRGVNLLRAAIEPLAETIERWSYDPPQPGVPSGYWRQTVSPLWVDRQRVWEPLFHWEDDGFQPLLEATWEEQEDWPEIEQTDLSGQNLSGLNLQGAYLYRVNLAGSILRRAKLQAAILVEVDLSQADLEKADLRETRAIGVRMKGANLTQARLERATLARADFSEARLTRARLRRANLALTAWRDAILTRARFSRNNLMGADFRGVDLTDLNLADAVIYQCMITPEQETPLLDALRISRDPNAPRPTHVWLPTP
jgi:uncharacterized protein YjbI with pentapeptide repeats